jgi:signal transduction histidine kinase
VLRTLDGRRLDVLATFSFSLAEERVLVTLTDVSAQRLAAREREARLAEMERAVHFSEMFIGILGHDLRSPLSAIASTAELLLHRPSAFDRATKPADRILKSAARMERMIAQLLDFTRIRLGRGIPLDRKEMDLTSVTRMVLEEVASARSRSISFEVAGDATGTWDRDRLSQLVSNLTTNACQHSPERTPVDVRINGADPAAVLLEVRNEGVIPAEFLTRIFEPLRSRSTKRSGARGLGLGLYISQQIVLAHGGQIRAESRRDRGTSFVVELPRRPRAQVGAVFGGEDF